MIIQIAINTKIRLRADLVMSHWEGVETWLRGYKNIIITQLIMKCFLLTNVKMPTIVGSLTYVSRKKK